MCAQAPLVAPSGRSTQRNGIMTGRKSDPVPLSPWRGRGYVLHSDRR